MRGKRHALLQRHEQIQDNDFARGAIRDEEIRIGGEDRANPGDPVANRCDRRGEQDSIDHPNPTHHERRVPLLDENPGIRGWRTPGDRSGPLTLSTQERCDCSSTRVAHVEPDHSWWSAFNEAPLSNIRVLGDDREALCSGVLPDRLIVGTAETNGPDMCAARILLGPATAPAVG